MARKKNKAIKQYKLKNGEIRYMFKVYQGMDPKTGKRRETTRRGFLNYREAEAEYEKLKVNGQKGNFINQITYNEVYEDCFKFYKRKDNRASTILKTQQYFKNHILPQLGHIKIQKIDYKICLEAAYVWYEALKYNKKIEQYAKQVFEHAVNLKYIDRNPMQSVSTPVKKHGIRKVSFYTREELIEFLEAAKKEPLKKYAYLRLVSYTGMRRREGFALTWSDIDFNNKKINVSKAVTIDDEGKLILGPTKNGYPREIYIDDVTLEVLKEWQMLQKDLLGKLIKDTLIFPNSQNNIAFPSKALDWCYQIQEKNNLKYVSPHGLRRTHATFYYASKAPHYEIQKRLGHVLNDVTSQSYIIETDETKLEAFQNFIKYMNYY